MTTAADILRKVDQEILTDESRWTKGVDARCQTDDEVDWASKDACRWCLDGAAMLAVAECKPEVFETAFRTVWAALTKAAVDHLGYESDEFSVLQFNDNDDTDFDDVKSVLKRAIEIAEKEDPC